jgi:hypothetical protein
MAIRQTITAALLLLLSGHTIAYESKYLCVVRHVGTVNDKGEIESQRNNHLLRRYIGNEFQVSKVSGAVTGAIVSNTSLNVVKTEIIDNGDRMRSFKMITVFGPHPSILYLQINDFPLALTKDGSITFLGFRWQEVISGTCRSN